MLCCYAELCNGSSWYIAFTLSVATVWSRLQPLRLAPPQSPPGLEKCLEVWRWLPALHCAHSVNSRLAPAHWGRSREDVEILSCFTSQQHRDYFSSRHPVQTQCQVEQFFSKSDNFAPQLVLSVSPSAQQRRWREGVLVAAGRVSVVSRELQT